MNFYRFHTSPSSLPGWGKQIVQQSKEGDKWMMNGDLHRVHGPAWIDNTSYGDKYEHWAVHGVSHNANGPAIVAREADNRHAQWYLHGINVATALGYVDPKTGAETWSLHIYNDHHDNYFPLRFNVPADPDYQRLLKDAFEYRQFRTFATYNGQRTFVMPPSRALEIAEQVGAEVK
jgi:hypothetical protein